MLRMAFVGMGWAGTRQVEAVAELDRKVEAACLMDTDEAHLKARSEELGIARTCTEYSGLLADPEIDAVSICTPHSLHCPMAVEAAEAGKHILVEKPMAMTVAEATRMLTAAAANAVKLYVAESASYSAQAKFLRQLVAQGLYIGELTAASVTAGFRAPDYGDPGRREWLSSPDRGGTGSWMLHGIHTMAQLRFALGEVRTVYMQQHRASSFKRDDLEGTMSGTLTLESGVQVSVLQTAESRLYADLGGYVLHGDRGSIRSGVDQSLLFTDEEDGKVIVYPPEKESVYAQEIESFADYVAGVSPGVTTGTVERRSLAIVEAGYESCDSGQPVNLADRFGSL